MISMALLVMGIGALALGGAALAGAVVGHPFGPYVSYPRYSPSFNPYYCQAYPYPMMCMGPGMGTSMPMIPGMGTTIGPGFYPWSPMPWFQPSMFGYS